MLTPQQIKKILQENDIAVLKKFGQNFLISESVLNKIVATANIKPTDTILEIGPGLGVLTFELAKRASKVIAIEKDRKMSEILKKNLAEKNISNIEVINEDALAVEARFLELLKLGFKGAQNRASTALEPKTELPQQSYKLVANLPYNIATAVIMKFLQSENPPQRIVVMVQKEVAQRIVAISPHMNKLAIFCQLYATPKIIDIVPPAAFWPKPKVDSAILQLIPRNSVLESCGSSVFRDPKTELQQPNALENLVNLGFSHPRKTLLNNFAKLGEKEKIGQWLLENNIQPSQRPETLSIHNWLSLAKNIELVEYVNFMLKNT
ncbi:MAG: 16S rRNA (adenine(1518)-N(6)/adenine(1519)-N(6))-dimethyltransferase RsmA [bacterium]|nr:16S rRNA (adenine(1518)-N(6)/adenine(1519)-N(6))-dimethyltransferase RsmA [bacterium]